MRRTIIVATLAGLIGAVVATPIAVYASHSFSDVPASNTFHADIEWLRQSGVTRGCNPPANTEFCPDDLVTREQMSAFMRRLAQYMGAEDGTPAQADNADTLDGEDSTAFLGTTQKAADADKLDGKDSPVFVEGSELGAAFAGGDQSEAVPLATVVRSLSITTPVDGKVIVNSTAMAFQDRENEGVRCSITPARSMEFNFLQLFESPGPDGARTQLAGTRGFDVVAGSHTFNLVCDSFGPSRSGSISDSSLTAIFIPNP